MEPAERLGHLNEALQQSEEAKAKFMTLVPDLQEAARYMGATAEVVQNVMDLVRAQDSDSFYEASRNAYRLAAHARTQANLLLETLGGMVEPGQEGIVAMDGCTDSIQELISNASHGA